MLHHVSVGVMDVERAAKFYDAVLNALGYKRIMEYLPHAIGYGESRTRILDPASARPERRKCRQRHPCRIHRQVEKRREQIPCEQPWHKVAATMANLDLAPITARNIMAPLSTISTATNRSRRCSPRRAAKPKPSPKAKAAKAREKSQKTCQKVREEKEESSSAGEQTS